MKHCGPALLSALGLVALVFVASPRAIDPGVTLIGTGFVPGDALDKSGLAGQQICSFDTPANCIDQATLGGFGSALAYTGLANIFLAVPDRGPFDGRTDVPYRDRAHYVHFAIDTGAPFPNIRMTLLDTVFLKDKHNQDLVGLSSDFDARFDPEGAAFSRDSSTFFVSDEYGPAILEFDLWGRLLRRIRVPAKFLIANPSGDVYLQDGATSLELDPSRNSSGRQANRGMEGLTISPDGRYLFGLMQNALIQDSGLNASTPPGRRGLNTRLLKVDLKTGKTWEYVYVVDEIANGRGLNDLLAINDHQFLVVERDNRSKRPTPPAASQTPIRKRIYKIDITNATDVSSIDSLPATEQELSGPPLNLNITPVAKTLFIDLLDPSYVVDASTATPLTIKDVIAEKIEGLAWGRDLPDGRHVLMVTSDNDLFAGDAAHPGGNPTQIYAFAVDDAAAGINVVQPRFRFPFFHWRW